MFCPDCGKEVPAGSKFCPGCGKATGAVPNAASSSGTAAPQANPNDAEQNKGMAVLAYILFFIPLLAGTHKTSEFVKYHTNQGIVLVIFYIAFSIITGILFAIFMGIAAATYAVGLMLAVPTIIGLLWIFPLILVIIGIINAATGKMKPLPLIGKFTILK
jgi:uncharacterized membrane protein